MKKMNVKIELKTGYNLESNQKQSHVCIKNYRIFRIVIDMKELGLRHDLATPESSKAAGISFTQFSSAASVRQRMSLKTSAAVSSTAVK